MPRLVGRCLAARRTTLWIGWIASGGASAAAALTARGDGAVLAGALLVLLVCAPMTLRLASDPLDPLGVYATLSGLCYGVMSLGWLGDVPPIPAPGVDRADVADSLVLVACGLLAFGVAARIVAGRVRQRPPLAGGETARMPTVLLIGMFALGAVGIAVGVASGAVGFNSAASGGTLAYAQVFQQLSLLGGLAAGACALWVFRRDDRRLRRLLFALVAAQVVLGFVSGYKQQALLPLLLVGAAYVSCRVRIPWKLITVGAVLGVLVLLPASILYRTGKQSADPALAAYVRSPQGLLNESVDYMSIRFRLIDSVAVIKLRTPEVYPYANGRRYILLPALLAVPRALWPDKPILNDGLEFSHTYWEVARNLTTATPLTQPGDLYRNFAWPGVILGLVIWGAAIGVLTRFNVRRRSPRRELVFLVALVQVVAFVDADLPQLLAGGSRTLLVAALVAWLALPGSTAPPGYTRVVERLARIRPDPRRRFRRAPADAAPVT